MKIMICGHSNYAECVFDTLKFFKADIDDDIVYFNDDANLPNNIERFLRDIDEDIVVLTDLLGGSPNALVMLEMKNEKKIKLISGLNVGGMLELLFKDELNDQELEYLVSEARNGLLYVNDLFNGVNR